MKIAMFTDAYFPRINGVAVSVRSYAGALTRMGHEVEVVCLEYSEAQQRASDFDEKSSDSKSPFRVVRIPSSKLIFSKEDRMMRLDKWHRIRREMDRFRPDVIHINSEWTVGYFGALYAHHRHVPFVFTFHTMWEDYLANYVSLLPDAALRKIGRGVVKFYLKRSDVIIAPTRRIADVVREYGIDNDVDILPTGISDSQFSFSFSKSFMVSAALLRNFPHLRGKKILLFVGRIVKEKNLPFLFDVLVEVRRKVPKCALLMIGGGPFLDELKGMAAARGLSDSVAFAGYIDSSELVYYYKMSSVFVFPSKTETQGLVTVEAMLSGLPVVAIGEMGTADVMEGDNGGFMVGDSVEEFSARAVELLTDSALRKRKSREALEWGGKWRISALAPRLVECYEKAVEIVDGRSSREAEKDYENFDTEFMGILDSGREES